MPGPNEEQYVISDLVDDGCDVNLEMLCPHLDLDLDMFTRVLVLYTGGTIGMKNVNGGMWLFFESL